MQRGEPVELHGLGGDGDQHGAGGGQRVDGDEPERGRAVEEHEAVRVRSGESRA